MKPEVNFDAVQEIFFELAKGSGVPDEELKYGWNDSAESNEWSLDYVNSLQKNIFDDIGNVMRCVRLHQKAMKNNDLVTAKASLIRLAVFSRSISNTFESIYDDCYKVLQEDKRFSWPEIDDDYVVPDGYLK